MPYISFHDKAGLAVLVILLRLIVIVVIVIVIVIILIVIVVVVVVLVVVVVRRHPWFSNQGVPGVGTRQSSNLLGNIK